MKYIFETYINTCVEIESELGQLEGSMVTKYGKFYSAKRRTSCFTTFCISIKCIMMNFSLIKV